MQTANPFTEKSLNSLNVNKPKNAGRNDTSKNQMYVTAEGFGKQAKVVNKLTSKHENIELHKEKENQKFVDSEMRHDTETLLSGFITSRDAVSND